ncbi:hypothetical protein HBH56_163420 [Parastagonospora nodorum]|uniref:Peptidase metallopeptidase domain-containing protein n=2 Tax=Phaeosphaeria nodorum (strain SN15 / ATCC MYA-4574 / FGSC 10173) TaxID=321614 RepID=A0A7U2NQ91_PHANO|nr:hypothetical protein HBH56_163420 [Parastagonospora nodorum]QRD06495.1 hypothetical protein JI435_118650 [Parastagonospora nodorum SN15]KAH3931733.1 hypothetical protein HBH54_085820 [Parastagonospora nodorum]KAH3972628.1 hypothetical protein HBH51_100360 [Parastagonospora nodorum]KAH3993849.1 hypothetical protein HBI10_197220 [Parastagonospora nodorum]
MARSSNRTPYITLIGDGNSDQSSRIYAQSAVSNVHATYDLICMTPKLYGRAPNHHLDHLVSYSSANSSVVSAHSGRFSDGVHSQDHDLVKVSNDDKFGPRGKLQCPGAYILRYLCQTERLHDDHVQEIQTSALAFNTNFSKTTVIRWAPGSTLYYYIECRGLSTVQATVIQTGMRTAGDHWQATGFGIAFEETYKRQEATFSIAYNLALGMDHYALAFFPGWQRRVIDIGARLLGEQQYVVEVLGHELGHILGLRHEFWKDNKEPGNAYQYPSHIHDNESIMNDRNVGDMSRFTISQADKDAIRQFYDLHPGQHKDIFIQDLIPRPAVEYLSLPPVQIIQPSGCAPATRRQSIP